ncbi:MAG: TIGR01212 family radical SAM protein [Treponema sp.]|nr:TIGR01212 family radical SAM protein [Candidatus Treponema equifaecale]
MLQLSDFYKNIFGCKTYKISLDAGCTCPNRDGSKGTGGCIFCSENGSGDFVAERQKSISEQIEAGKKLVEKKAKGRSGTNPVKYIAYFQNFTSTYGDIESLKKKYYEALECEEIAGLSIATRPDCLNDEILSVIAKIAETHFVQIELGLQTSNEETGKTINRCYTNSDYEDAVRRIKKSSQKIHIVTHLIFGLPGETEEDMLNSVDFVVKNNCGYDEKFGIKITVLYVVKNTKLALMYQNGEFKCLEKEQYFELLEKALKKLPENCVIHRLTGDPPKSILVAPEWTTDKKRVMNEISGILNKCGA